MNKDDLIKCMKYLRTDSSTRIGSGLVKTAKSDNRRYQFSYDFYESNDFKCFTVHDAYPYSVYSNTKLVLISSPPIMNAYLIDILEDRYYFKTRVHKSDYFRNNGSTYRLPDVLNEEGNFAFDVLHNTNIVQMKNIIQVLDIDGVRDVSCSLYTNKGELNFDEALNQAEIGDDFYEFIRSCS